MQLAAHRSPNSVTQNSNEKYPISEWNSFCSIEAVNFRKNVWYRCHDPELAIMESQEKKQQKHSLSLSGELNYSKSKQTRCILLVRLYWICTTSVCSLTNACKYNRLWARNLFRTYFLSGWRESRQREMAKVTTLEPTQPEIIPLD